MNEFFNYIRSDYQRYGRSKEISFARIIIYALRGSDSGFTYSFWLRLASCRTRFSRIARFMHNRLSRQYEILIPASTKIGYGLYIGHAIGIVVNGSAVIGNNCNLSQFSTIGSNHGKAATIGDNVYIGPSVCIVEDVVIGNNVTIGAGAVVVKDIPDDVTVAGVPAKIISNKKPGRYILNRWGSVVVL